MDLKGNELFEASPQTIWSLLMDTDTLAKITPGVSTLEHLDGDNYKAIADVKIGPVRGSFSGNLSLTDKVENESFQLKVDQKSKIGNVNAKVEIQLKAMSDTQTELSFNGKAMMSGLLARTGSRVMSGVANTLTKQFFQALKDELHN